MAVVTKIENVLNENVRFINGMSFEIETWIHAASSEDEFDMFITALSLARLINAGVDIFGHPNAAEVTKVEGWILGVDETCV